MIKTVNSKGVFMPESALKGEGSAEGRLAPLIPGEHPEIASAYERLKVNAAAENRYDIVGYMKMKDEFIKRTTQKAVDSYKGIQLL